MFGKIKKDILGEHYELSIGLVTAKKSREINKKYRHKDKPTNVLSFSFSKNSGELVLCPTVIRREAKDNNHTYKQWLQFLVIHGMLHLKGLEHSSTMERAEKFYTKKYDTKYHSRNRRGIFDDEDRGGRVLKRRKKS